jgi:hypothetical protein
MIIETVKIKGGSKGSRIINKSDFVDGVHELFDADSVVKESFTTEKPKPVRKAK